MRVATEKIANYVYGNDRSRIPFFDRTTSMPLRGSFILDGNTVYYGDDINWIPLANGSQIPVMSNEGVGSDIFDTTNSTPTNFLLRRLNADVTVGNEGIYISPTGGTTVTIGNTLTGSNIGTGINYGDVFAQKSGNQLQFRKLVASAGITLNQTPDTILISSSGGGGGLSGLSNETGPGVQIYDDVLSVGSTAFIRTLQAGTGLSVGISGAVGQEVITFNNTSPASSVTLTSAGGTESLVNDGTGPSLATKGLTAGTGIALTASGTDITISNTSPGGVTGSNYIYSYDTTTQLVSLINTYQNITFSTNVLVNGWTHTPGTADFVCNQTGIYNIFVLAVFVKGTGNADLTTRITNNNVEVTGSVWPFHLHTSATDHVSGTTQTLCTINSGDIIRVQMAADDNSGTGIDININPPFVTPSIKITITRLA